MSAIFEEPLTYGTHGWCGTEVRRQFSRENRVENRCCAALLKPDSHTSSHLRIIFHLFSWLGFLPRAVCILKQTQLLLFLFNSVKRC